MAHRERLAGAARLIERGHDIRGYLHWTLTDNFEWNEGWTLRFGLVALDPKTQLRTMRGSARLFREIIRGNGVTAQPRRNSSPRNSVLG